MFFFIFVYVVIFFVFVLLVFEFLVFEFFFEFIKVIVWSFSLVKEVVSFFGSSF